MIPPEKPFDSYKWRWLSVAPTESLLDPPVFLGVLRAFARHENDAPSSGALATDLARVQADTKTTVDLVRTPDRNLVRNSGQYWKGTGLLRPTSGLIELTNLGHRVASGKMTQGEFAALMIQQTVLPNPWTYTTAEFHKWKAAGLEIRPLKLILEVINSVGRAKGLEEAYLTPNELIAVVIPLAGAKESVANMTTYVLRYRKIGPVVVSGWPNCAPAANDPRLAREFLLFLANFDILRREQSSDRYNERFRLDELFNVDAATPATAESIFGGAASAKKAIDEMIHSDLPSIIERQKTLASVLVRTGQAKFRSKVLSAYSGRCLITGETISQVLEAAHIVPVNHGGADTEANSFCLRVDMHRLFDGGNLRIKSDGSIVSTTQVSASHNYKALPSKITLPAFVNPANVDWRNSYL